MSATAYLSAILSASILLGLFTIPDPVTEACENSMSELPTVRSPSAVSFVINEVLFAPSDTDAEFIEVLNLSDQPLPLASLTYADANQDFDPVLPSALSSSFRENAELASGGYLVLVRDSTAFATAFPDAPRPIASTAESMDRPASVLVVAPDDWEALNNGGDTVFIRDDSAVVSRVAYESSWADDDASTERIDPNGPALPFNFASSVRSIDNDNPSSTNAATPGTRNSVYAVDTTPPVIVAAEEQAARAGGRTVLRIFFSEGLDSTTVVPSAFRIGSAPRSVIASVNLRENLRDVDLALTLNHAPLSEISTTPDSGSNAPAHGASPFIRVRGVKDRIGNRMASDKYPLALQPPEASLRVTEIMFDPRSDDRDGWPDQTEYVEIENTTRFRVALRRTQLTGAPDEHGVPDVLATVETGDVLNPGKKAVMYAERGLPEAISSPLLALQQAFPEIDTTAGAWIAIPSSSLRLTNSGRSLLLNAADSAQLDSLTYDPDWHVSDVLSTDGVALERVSTTASSVEATNWTSSAHPDGGTPGAVNSVYLPPGAAPPKTTNEAHVHVAPSPFSIERDTATRIRYELDGPRSLRVEIYDAHGRPIRTVTKARRTAAQGELLWDGRDDDGRRVPVGIYVIWFEAVDADGGHVDVVKKTVVLARPL